MAVTGKESPEQWTVSSGSRCTNTWETRLRLNWPPGASPRAGRKNDSRRARRTLRLCGCRRPRPRLQ
jgi:hypothetical protein